MILTCKAFPLLVVLRRARVEIVSRPTSAVMGAQRSALEHGRDEQTPLQGAWCAGLNPRRGTNQKGRGATWVSRRELVIAGGFEVARSPWSR